MCPGCAAMALIVAGGVVSTGGLTALTLKVLRKNKTAKIESKDKE